MRVRHLQSQLHEHQLISIQRIEQLSGLKLGIDAIYWLRSIQALKDPFADALGGVPPALFSIIDKEIDAFRHHNITPVFVFKGIAPAPQNSMTIKRMDQQMSEAWNHVATGDKSKAQTYFAVATSRINGDFMHCVFHHIRERGCQVIQAPYFAGAQLSHFMEQGIVQAVFGPPGLLLFGAPRVIIQVDFKQRNFDWVDLEAVLEKWSITRTQFVETCMMAGTEYCSTYPYLNLGSSFSFDTAVQIVRQSPLISWMPTFPTEEMKAAHLDGYCKCKVLVQSSPVLHIHDMTVRPMASSFTGDQSCVVPFDFSEIIGDQLPQSLYFLLVNGFISYKLPQAFAKGEWTEKTPPLVDTQEYRTLLMDLWDHRRRALGLIARHLTPEFQKKSIYYSLWDPPMNTPERRIMKPDLKKQIRWNISAQSVAAELDRQGVSKVDFKFCLAWHAHDIETNGMLMKDNTNTWHKQDMKRITDKKAMAATVYFMVLESVELIAADGGMTVLGHALKDCPNHLQEPCLVALELMKLGILTGEPFDAVGRPFPEKVNYPRPPIDPWTKSVFLLSRTMSLVPMKLKSNMWNTDVDFDLAAFHCLVRVVKRALRHLTEASLASVLLQDISRVKLLPQGFMCSTPKGEDPTNTPAILPTFALPRACMGIVCLYFLKYNGDPKHFHKAIVQRFQCCHNPLEDLKGAFVFWEDLKRCVLQIAEPLGATDLADSMKAAGEVLARQRKILGV
eukprot:gb/GFBE01037884.1/.p1 GENE.gb/GFBE01037884.1/~~gb/GFBE01037884.1/.p1  ORF type:complete len:731 (+),score=127.65 gb/GFBE01037884.1/:1-2193(+)